MSENVLPATERERAGKGAARALRREGMVPAVVYGAKQPPVMVSLEARLLYREINKGAFLSTLYQLKISKKTEQVLARDIQMDPVSDHLVHIDFLRLGEHSEVTLMLPVHFVGEDDCPGLTRGGILNVVRHEIEMRCRAGAIPDVIEVSLEGYDIGDSIHISDIKLPQGAEPTITDRDFTVATIAAPKAEPEPSEEEEELEEEEAEEGTEGEEEQEEESEDSE